jgi:hypothetical protein
MTITYYTTNKFYKIEIIFTVVIQIAEMSIIGHRGVTGNTDVIENTMRAFDVCFSTIVASGRKSGGIELDLQETADGEIVIFHDDTLPNSLEAIRDYEYEELMGVCDHIPKFSAFVYWLCGLQDDNLSRLDIVLDIKPQNCSSLLLSINRILSSRNFSVRVHFYLGIWTHEWLRIVQRYGWPHGSLMLIADDTSCFRELRQFDTLSIDIRLVKRNPIIALKVWWWRRSHPARRLAFWTINKKLDMKICKFLGTDAVIVDDVVGSAKIKN